MKCLSSTLIVLAVMALATSAASAQSTKPVSLGISAGATIPVSDLSNDYSTGYNGTVSLMFNSYGSPIGFRIDGMYNKLSSRTDNFVNLPDIRIMSANANVVYALPGVGIRPYLIGGAGIYNLQSDAATAVTGSSSINKFGLNGGVGVSFPLSGFNTFAEARFHHVFTSDNYSTSFIPVTFGISF